MTASMALNEKKGLMDLIQASGIHILTKTKVDEIKGTEVVVENEQGSTSIPCDNAVYAGRIQS